MAPKRKMVISDNEESDGLDKEKSHEPQAPTHGRRVSKPSAKKAQLNVVDLEAEEKRLNARQREIKRQKRNTLAHEESGPAHPPIGDDELESKEDLNIGSFPNTIRPLQATSETPSYPRGELWRVGPAAAFVSSSRPAVPHIPARVAKAPVPSDDGEMSADNAVDEALWPMPTIHATMPSTAVSTRLPLQPSALPNIDMKVPGFRAAAVINPKKPKAADYDEITQALILHAASEYEVLISTKDAFPNTATRLKWALKVWRNANRNAEENYGITDAINSLLRQQGLHIRGYALGLARPYLINMLGFKKGSDPSTIVANQQLAQRLKPADGARFPFKFPDNCLGYGEAKIIAAIIEAVWFEDAKSQGIAFDKLINPIPLETMALVLTIVDFCIDEWSTGRFIKAKIWESNVIERHKVFRKDLEGWNLINETVVEGIRKKMFMHASRNAGIVDISAAKQMLVGDVLERARQELDGRTGETDSEAED